MEIFSLRARYIWPAKSRNWFAFRIRDFKNRNPAIFGDTYFLSCQLKLAKIATLPAVSSNWPTWYLKSQESNEQKCWIWMLSAIWMLSVPGFQRSLYCIRMKICEKSNFLAYFFQEICYKKLKSCVNYFKEVCEIKQTYDRPKNIYFCV